jgi:hypothetical protein
MRRLCGLPAPMNAACLVRQRCSNRSTAGLRQPMRATAPPASYAVAR